VSHVMKRLPCNDCDRPPLPPQLIWRVRLRLPSGYGSVLLCDTCHERWLDRGVWLRGWRPSPVVKAGAA